MFPVGQKFTYTQLVFGSIAFNLSGICGTVAPHLANSEIAGRQIQNNRNPIIKIPQTYKYFTSF